MVSQADSYRIFCVLVLAPAVRTIWDQEQRAAGCRRKQKRRELKRKSGTTALTSDVAAANPIGNAAKRETGSPINAPQAAQHPASSSAQVVELQPADHSDGNS